MQKKQTKQQQKTTTIYALAASRYKLLVLLPIMIILRKSVKVTLIFSLDIYRQFGCTRI